MNSLKKINKVLEINQQLGWSMRVTGKGLCFQLNPKGREGAGLQEKAARRVTKIVDRESPAPSHPYCSPHPPPCGEAGRHMQVSLSQTPSSSCFIPSS